MEAKGHIAKLDRITSGFQHAQILFTAIRSGIFDMLSEPKTADEVADALGWDSRGVRMLLDGLVGLEVIENRRGSYVNGVAAQVCLVAGAPADQRDIIMHRAHGWDAWAQLEESVKTGNPAPAARRERSPEELRAFILGMDNIARFSADELVQRVDLTGCKRLLDIGGGPASYALTLLKHYPDMEATVFDRPEVLPIAQEQIEAAGMTDRIRLVDGDLSKDAFEPGHDLMLMSNIIHSFDDAANRDIVLRCHAALEPGGKLIIKDFLIEPDRSGPAFGLIFALQMLLHCEGGDTYTTLEVSEWTTAAGFGPGELVELSPQSRLWVTQKA